MLRGDMGLSSPTLKSNISHTNILQYVQHNFEKSLQNLKKYVHIPLNTFLNMPLFALTTLLIYTESLIFIFVL